MSRPLKDGDVARVRMEANVSPTVRAEVDADRVFGESRGDVLMRWAQVRRDQRVVANRHALFARESANGRLVDLHPLTGQVLAHETKALGLSALHAYESGDDVAVYARLDHSGYVLVQDGHGVVLRPQDTLQERA